jgi:hypothetical protein
VSKCCLRCTGAKGALAVDRYRRKEPEDEGLIELWRPLRVSAFRNRLRRDPHGCVKQIHHEELEDGEKERPSAFPKITLKQTDSGIQ